ncbi:NACHT domain-containing protein [Leptolyngbya sp. KIOST-1]|uniref:NACHT domain-containing protein n=1 Tax=Leptolyngbya sp. KIOST-1 TaxID=1229172 RepID=UPI000566E635|nr:NACHT domain-containing protein [Leptolyngbya sp. KIOST-1]
MISPDLISGITFWIFKSLWESRDETYKLLSQRLSQSIFYASKEYQANYIARHGFIRQEEFRPSVSLPKLYVSPSLVDQEIPASPRAKASVCYREIDYLKKLNLTYESGELTEQYKHIVIKGESGIGKTTFLKKLGLEAFRTKENQASNGCIPVFVQVAQCLKDEFNLQTMIEEEFKICGFPEYKDFVDSALRRGKLLILIDEIDAIPNQFKDGIVGKIKSFSDLYKNNRVVVACRKSLKTQALTQFHTINILGFSSAQAQKFIFKATQVQSGEVLPASACQKIWHRIGENDKATKLVVHNPFCLSIVLSLYQDSVCKLSGRTILYEKILSNLLGTSISPGTLNLFCKGSENSIEARLGILSEMAYVCLKSGRHYFHKMEIQRLYSAIVQKRSIQYDASDFASIREENLNDFIINGDESLCHFGNPLIQKILVSHYLMNSLKNLDEAINQFLDASEWKDVFIFLAGMQGADYLLSIIQKRVFSNINTSSLASFMGWVEAAAEEVCISSNQAANRCYVAFMVLEIILLFGDRSHDQVVISSILKKIKELISLLDPGCQIIHSLNAKNVDIMKLGSSQYIDPKIMKGLSLERLLDLAVILSEKAQAYKLINQRNALKLLSTISRIRHQLEGKTVSAYHRKVCERNLYKLWMTAFGMPDTFPRFTTGDLQSLHLYCRGSCLIVHCLREAFYVSGKLQDDVVQTLFTDPVVNLSTANQ